MATLQTPTSFYRSVWPLSLLAFKVTAHTLAFPRAAREVQGGKSEEFHHNRCQSSMLEPVFRRHVKPKKQHEIQRLGELVKKLSDATGCNCIVDVGSGQGHLSRFLSFGLGLSVTAVETDKHLATMATKFDQQLGCTLQREREKAMKCLSGEGSHSLTLQMPRHVLGWVDPKASWEQFILQLRQDWSLETQGSSIRKTDLSQADRRASKTPRRPHLDCQGGAFATDIEKELAALTSEIRAEPEVNGIGPASSSSPDEHRTWNGHSYSDIRRTSVLSNCGPIKQPVKPRFSPKSGFVLTGLHACGDLSVAMLRHFARCPDIVGVTSVACCYMKISTAEMPVPPGGPRLPEAAQPSEPGYPMSAWVAQLAGHQLSYKSREVACHAIEEYAERLRRKSSGLRTHCFRAMLETVIRELDPSKKRLGVQTIKKAHELSFGEYARQGLARVGLDPTVSLDEVSVEAMLSQQQNVVAFFSLALLLAPLVETLLLLDRMIFLQESGFQCELLPLFDPTFSPRNLVLVAAKPTSSNPLTVNDLGTRR
uniref:Protein RRNAD1 isoform X2 n=1 Tax=Geotrypetes seraphini TaxID=260995 RepID=A0A6P8PI75_GEOSA|nr:protein RRNAD1 isoform X2 [Geotrypetes seraphini]XP_033781105.1 protein RRNAD1 isoform X2 [Geotrypetes seraphini]XP_033781106.1 protein RRNAD1 isoform X2 [Geotrypetes seraphini]XP_033781107.1 protein RRNAD1 isoform X2 [Geotrypetes seraphini]